MGEADIQIVWGRKKVVNILIKVEVKGKEKVIGSDWYNGSIRRRLLFGVSLKR